MGDRFAHPKKKAKVRVSVNECLDISFAEKGRAVGLIIQYVVCYITKSSTRTRYCGSRQTNSKQDAMIISNFKIVSRFLRSKPKLQTVTKQSTTLLETKIKCFLTHLLFPLSMPPQLPVVATLVRLRQHRNQLQIIGYFVITILVYSSIIRFTIFVTLLAYRKIQLLIDCYKYYSTQFTQEVI